VDWSLFFGIRLIWGSSFLLIMLALDTFHPGLITWARVGLGAIALRLLRRGVAPIERGDRNRVTLLSLIWVAIPFTMFPLAEQHISSAMAGLLIAATPVFATLWGVTWFGRPTGRVQHAGITVGFVGVALMSLGTGGGNSAALGVVMVLGATVCYGWATNAAAPLQRKYGSVPLMGAMLGFGAVWTAPFGIFGLTQSTFALGPVVAVTVLGVVGTGIAFALMATLIGRIGGPRASFITYLMPLVSLVLGMVFLSETVTGQSLVGTALVLAASFLASRPETRPAARRRGR
jgi:drug/metabolite transporter (DMT)-like permease